MRVKELVMLTTLGLIRLVPRSRIHAKLLHYFSRTEASSSADKKCLVLLSEEQMHAESPGQNSGVRQLHQKCLESSNKTL